MLILPDLLTSSGKYPDRTKSKELTQELLQNGQALLDRVNSLLAELGVESVTVSSGFRPSSVNSSLSNAAKKSLHMQCRAVDLEDDDAQSLGNLILKSHPLLAKHGLWIEDLEATKGKFTNWVHLDDSDTRKDREVRVFKP